MNNQETDASLYSQIRKSGIYTVAGKAVTPFINFLITIYIIRKLTVDEYGIYNVLLGIMMYIGLFSSLGLPDIFQRFIPEFHTKKNIQKIKKLVLEGSFLRTVLATLLILIVIIFSNLLGDLLKIDNWVGYFELFSLAIIFSLEARLIGLVLTSLFLHKYFVISNIAYVIFRAALLYFLLDHGWALRGLLLGEAVMYGILLLLFSFFYYSQFIRRFSDKNKSSDTKLPMKRFIKYGSFSYFNEMGVMILDVSTDFLVISIFLGPVAVGIYAFANRVSDLLSRLLPHSLLYEVIRPSFYVKYVDTESKEHLKKMGNMLIKIVAFFSIPLTFGIIILGDKVILYLFDPKYISSLKILWIVAAFMTFQTFQLPFGLILQSIEKVDILFYSKIFSIYNLVFDLIVVKHWGIIGVALVTGSAILFQNIFLYFSIRKHLGFSLYFKPLFLMVLNSLPMAFFIFLSRGFITNLPSLAVVVVFGGCVYLVMAYLNKTFGVEERRVLNSIIGKSIFIF